ncbi:MAG TPA: glycosyl hydrolase 115 family protein, partial [Bacteroidales bacterium]|nr:glycosyl hydrolase 115 family protein [Bacteroidales bacterium]
MRIINKLLITFSLTGIFYLTSQNIHGQQPPQVFFTETAGAFPIAGKNHLPAIVIDTTDAKVVQIAAEALANDVERISGRKPVVLKNPSKLPEYAIVIGTAGQSKYIDKLSEKADLPFDSLKGTWERYIITQREKPVRGVKEALIIAGSDRRGTAYGVFELSRRMGVSPWYWWADVLPDHHETIMIGADNYLSHSPSVRYRGIFLNDEDWGLQPWAAKTFESETGDIGPKTYAKIF